MVDAYKLSRRVIGALSAVADDGGSEYIGDSGYGWEIDEYDRFLRHHGVEHYNAGELSKPNNPEALSKTYMWRNDLLPPTQLWIRQLPVVLLLDHMCRHVDCEATVLHAWRPVAYNRAVGGRMQSDHLDASAIDVHISDRGKYERAIEYFGEQWDTGEFGLSIGTDESSLHVGVYSPLTVARLAKCIGDSDGQRVGYQRRWCYR